MKTFNHQAKTPWVFIRGPFLFLWVLVSDMEIWVTCLQTRNTCRAIIRKEMHIGVRGFWSHLDSKLSENKTPFHDLHSRSTQCDLPDRSSLPIKHHHHLNPLGRPISTASSISNSTSNSPVPSSSISSIARNAEQAVVSLSEAGWRGRLCAHSQCCQ